MYSCTPSIISVLDGWVGVNAKPQLFLPRKYPVPIVWEAGWAPGPVWMSAENLAPTGI